jgi:hypothetical protein
MKELDALIYHHTGRSEQAQANDSIHNSGKDDS